MEAGTPWGFKAVAGSVIAETAGVVDGTLSCVWSTIFGTSPSAYRPENGLLRRLAKVGDVSAAVGDAAVLAAAAATSLVFLVLFVRRFSVRELRLAALVLVMISAAFDCRLETLAIVLLTIEMVAKRRPFSPGI